MNEQPNPSDLVIPPLNTSMVGARILVFPRLDSTNTTALRIGGDGTVVLADTQTAGRGRQGRSWHSAPGKGVYVTVTVRGPLDGLPFAAALAVRDALRPYVAPQIKWPNDLLLDGRKISGILVEHRERISAVGIGVNVNQEPADFPAELRDSAASVCMATGKPLDRALLARDVLQNLDRRILALRDGGYAAIRDEWAGACNLEGRRVRYKNMVATVSRIDVSGALILATPEGDHRLMAGESRDVTLLGGVDSCSL